MKTLLLIRHAKSDWSTAVTSDFDRPLNDRGKRDAPMMAERMLEREIKIESFISSPARRARKTAQAFAKAYDKDKEDLILIEDLYLASVEFFYDAIAKAKDKHDTVALFSHNPGITDFANRLTDTRIDNIPTCGIFAVKVTIKKWEDFEKADKEFLFFDYPKAGLD